MSREVLPPGAGSPPPTSGGNDVGPAEVETTNVQPVDEDDRVIVPAAPLSALGPRTHHRATAPRVPMVKTLQFRRTAIPILLTTGAILLAVAALKFVVSPDSVMATLTVGMCLALVGAAVLLLGVAALNMMQVRQKVDAQKGNAPHATSANT